MSVAQGRKIQKGYRGMGMTGDEMVHVRMALSGHGLLDDVNAARTIS